MIVLGVLIRVGWTTYVSYTLQAEYAAYEADLAKLSPEARQQAERATAEALARDLLGTELAAELGASPPPPKEQVRVIRYEEPPPEDLPPWVYAGAIGAMVLLVGAAGSWFILRPTPRAAAGPDDLPPEEPGRG